MGKKKKLDPMVLAKIKYRYSKEKNAKDQYQINLMLCITLILAILLAMFCDKNSPDYNKVQNGAFVVCVLTIFYSFAIAKLNKSFFDALKNGMTSNISLSLEEKKNLFVMTSFVLALIGLMIVDMSFLNNGGIRIGAVVAIAFVKVLAVLMRD